MLDEHRLARAAGSGLGIHRHAWRSPPEFVAEGLTRAPRTISAEKELCGRPTCW